MDLWAALEASYLIPSTKYFTDTMLPQTYESLKIKVQTELSQASFLSFTSDNRQYRGQRHHIFL